jgi:hypothetical protein
VKTTLGTDHGMHPHIVHCLFSDQRARAAITVGPLRCQRFCGRINASGQMTLGSATLEPSATCGMTGQQDTKWRLMPVKNSSPLRLWLKQTQMDSTEHGLICTRCSTVHVHSLTATEWAICCCQILPHMSFRSMQTGAKLLGLHVTPHFSLADFLPKTKASQKHLSCRKRP